MSEITVSRPEVVNENTDVICSTSVRSRSLEYDNFPEISEANILSTFEQLHQNKDEVFERGVINVFKGLSWDYKTNSPCKFGSKIIVNNLVRWDQWGFHLISGMQADRLADLERMLHLLSGKPIPDNRGNITIKEGANKQVISSQADSLIKISRIWADFFPANTSNQPI